MNASLKSALIDTTVPTSLVSEYIESLIAGINELKKAYAYAQDANQPHWEFAVSAYELIELGMSFSDLRWLVLKNYVERGVEVTGPADQCRSFRPPAGTEPLFNCCFVLTESGVDHLRNLLCDFTKNTVPLSKTYANSPHWDSVRHELSFGRHIVKRFRLPSPNQEKILNVFQEEGWPPYIDDPLPPLTDKCSRQRLHDTIRSLNRNQKARLIRFLGDGTGTGIRWERNSSNVRFDEISIERSVQLTPTG
jgi:hypothetical protein